MFIPTRLGPWPKYPLLYEINARVWLKELSLRVGKPLTLDKIPAEEIERIVRLGFHGIWLMGVWTTGAEPTQIARSYPQLQNEYRQALPDFKADDILGSPYAVTEYSAAPILGGPAALAGLREKLSRYGVRLMLDFVFNHTACDHKLVCEKPEVFIQGTPEDLAREPHAFFKNANGVIIAHGRDPHFPPWTDTAQINYGQAPAHEAMRRELLTVAEQCDGIRCDMAMLMLPETLERIWGKRLGPNWIRRSFWREVLDELNTKFPDHLFLAESYWNLEAKLQEEGFHFTYDKTLYDRLRAGDHKGTRQHLNANRNFQDHCARFVENHDEARAVAAFGAARSRAAAAVCFFAPGLKLIHEGQLEGRRTRTPVQLGRRPFENEDNETALYYEKLLNVLQDPMFQTAEFSVREVRTAGWGDTSNESLIALHWCSRPQNGPSASKSRHLGYLVVVNLNPWRAYGRVPLPGAMFENNKQYIFHDRLDGKRYERAGGELVSPGLYIALEANQQHLFEIYQK